MKNRKNILFLQQDICKLSTVILLLLSLISGFSIIYSRNYLSGSFRVDNIYAMYSTISNFLLIFMAVNLLGKEFKFKTINLIRISGRTAEEIVFRKLFVMVILSLLSALLVFLEVFIFEFLIFKNSSMDVIRIGIDLLRSYLLYGVFLFLVGSILVLFLKNILYSFIALLLGLRLGVTVMNIMGNFEATAKLTPYIPLSFIENSFYFAKYTVKQSIVLVIWSVLLLLILVVVYKKRGYK